MLVRYERNVGTARSRCIFIPDGADAADESGYVGSLLPLLCLPPPYPGDTFLNSRAATPFPPTILPSRPPDAVIFSASSPFATSKPVLLWIVEDEDGVFGHAGVRPNAAIHHPRCNTPYNVLCRMANPSPILMLLPKQAFRHPFPHESCIMRRGVPLKADSWKIFSPEESPPIEIKWDYYDCYYY